MHRFHRWRELLDAAHTAPAVEEVMRNYAATLAPVMEALPPECRRAIEFDDLQTAAVVLLHCELGYNGSAELQQTLHEIAHTYAAASLRLAKIRAEPVAPTAD